MNISLLVLTLCSSILSTTNNINSSPSNNNTTNLISNVPSITTQYLSSQLTTTDTSLVNNNIHNNVFTSSTEPNQSNKEKEIKLEDNEEQSKEIFNNKLKESNQQSNNIGSINLKLENQSKDTLTSSLFIKSSTVNTQLKDNINESGQGEELTQLEEGDNEDIDLVSKNEHQHHFIPIPSFIKRSINIIRKVFQFDNNNNNQLNFSTSTDDNEIILENNKQDLTSLSKNQQDQPNNKIREIKSDIPIPATAKEQLNKGLSKGAIGGIIGGVVGLLILLSLVGGILFYFLRHKKPTAVFGNNQANEEGGLLTQANNDIEEVILSPINPINKFWPNIEFNPKNQRFSNMSMIESNNNNNNNNTHSTKVSKFANINKPNTSSPIPINLSNSAGQLKHTPSFKLPNKTNNETIYERRMKKKSQDNSINTTTSSSSLLSSMVDDIGSVTEYETDYDEINMDVHIQQMKSDDNSDKDSIELCSVVRSSIINPKLDQLNEVHLRSPSIPPPNYGMNYSKGNNINQSLFTVEKKDMLKEESTGLLSTNENYLKDRNDRSVSPINRSISPINMTKEEKKKYIFPSEYRVSNVETSDSTNSGLAKVTKLTISSKLKDYNESNPKLSTIPPTTANSIKKSTNRNSTVNQKFGFNNEKYQLDGLDYTNIGDNSFNGIPAEKETDKEIDRRSLDVNRHSLRQTKLFSENRSLLTSGRLQHHRQVSENVRLDKDKDKETGTSTIIKERRKKDLVKHLAGQPPSTPITPKQQALDTDFWGL